ncbi:MAG: hypothetical protein KDG54_11215 [Geminicoccaceae bacterium]|nr:hypothetical protein [Geminicoccaceae bacterium]
MITDTLNPKDAIGQRKAPLGLVPAIGEILLSLGIYEGALKYEPFNWRESPVRMSIYISAIRRHLAKLWEGEWEDPETHVPHLASIMAGCTIIADARLHGTLHDDRPEPTGNAVAFLNEDVPHIVAHLQDIFGGRRIECPSP